MNLPVNPETPTQDDTAPAAADEATPATSVTPAARKDGVPRAAVMRVLERLFQLYPKLFGARFVPLKLGVFEELLQRHPDFDKGELKAALGFHARSTRYLEAVASGIRRHDLDGRPVEELAPEHVHHAIMEVFRRRQGKSKQDLKPWLRARLVQAIGASRLAREEYLLRVHARDEDSSLALDEAFAEIGEAAAKREAIRRAYEASGHSVEEFAGMYGMDVQAVKAALTPLP